MLYSCTSLCKQDVAKCAASFLAFLERGVLDQGIHVVLLDGPLGSGKTTFIQEVAKQLGVRDVVDSPTFVMIQEYSIPQDRLHGRFHSLIHVDTYRANTIHELRAIGVDEYFQNPYAFVMVEWGRMLLSLCDTLKVPYILLSFSVQNEKYSIQQLD